MVCMTIFYQNSSVVASIQLFDVILWGCRHVHDANVCYCTFSEEVRIMDVMLLEVTRILSQENEFSLCRELAYFL